MNYPAVLGSVDRVLIGIQGVDRVQVWRGPNRLHRRTAYQNGGTASQDDKTAPQNHCTADQNGRTAGQNDPTACRNDATAGKNHKTAQRDDGTAVGRPVCDVGDISLPGQGLWVREEEEPLIGPPQDVVRVGEHRFVRIAADGERGIGERRSLYEGAGAEEDGGAQKESVHATLRDARLCCLSWPCHVFGSGGR